MPPNNFLPVSALHLHTTVRHTAKSKSDNSGVGLANRNRRHATPRRETALPPRAVVRTASGTPNTKHSGRTRMRLRDRFVLCSSFLYFAVSQFRICSRRKGKPKKRSKERQKSSTNKCLHFTLCSQSMRDWRRLLCVVVAALATARLGAVSSGGARLLSTAVSASTGSALAR